MDTETRNTLAACERFILSALEQGIDNPAILAHAKENHVLLVRVRKLLNQPGFGFAISPHKLQKQPT